MKRIIAWILVIGTLIGGMLRFLPIFPPSRVLWILQLVTSELGLLLAIPLFIFAFKTVKSRPLAVLSGLAFLVSILPTLEVITQERNWIWDLHYSLVSPQLPDTRLPNPYSGELLEPLFQITEFFRLPEKMAPVMENFPTRDGASLPIAVYASKAETPKGWILAVHGGGWNSGNPTNLDSLYAPFLKAGYSVFAPSYRFAPTYTWPKQLEDIQASFDWVQKNADRFAIDKTKFWILGRSAGGQIALKFAYGLKPLQPRGAIAIYTPTDLNFGYRWSFETDVLGSKTLMKDYVGGSPDERQQAYLGASPLYDVTKDSPPTLLLQGKADPLVWYRHSIRLRDRAKEVGARATLIELPWATHGFDFFPNSPGGQVTRNSILRFMKETASQ